MPTGRQPPTETRKDFFPTTNTCVVQMSRAAPAANDNRRRVIRIVRVRNAGRWLWAGALVALLAALLAYTARVSRTAVAPEPGPAQAAPGTQPRAPRFTHIAQCRDCHPEIYAEWARDQHATSWTEPLFKTYTRDYTQVECLSCHAPQPMLEVGVARAPQLRPSFREEGVNCLACHLKGGLACGTLLSGASCAPEVPRTPALRTSQACYPCHSAHNLFKEYQDSEQFRRGLTCQDCHMEKITRPVATGGPVRPARRHLFTNGGHDTEGLKAVLKAELAASGNELVVMITNVGAAHGVPGEIADRLVRMELSVLARPAQPGAPQEELLAREEIFRAPRRLARDKVPTTQILPGQPRVKRYPLPAPHGKAIVTLTYKLFDFIPDADATPMARAELEF